MHDELVKRLRIAAQLADKGLVITPSICLEAADAIEELTRENKELSFRSAQLEAMNDALIGETGAADALMVVSQPRWIPVRERLPELRQNVLVSDGKGSGEGWLDRYDWHDPNREDVVYTSPQPRDFWCIPGCNVDEDHVTHWMPLPQGPEGRS